MKKKICLLVFFLLLKPIIPVLQYTIGYDYIVKELCQNRERPELQCNGTCYLKLELAKASENEGSSSTEKKKLKVEITLLYLVTTPLNLDFFDEEKTKINTLYINLYRYLNAFSVFHPPTIGQYFL